ncbi:hypothetical protein MAR_037125 [Mya arenaria]|uniref:Uncharacterized protein n=1 Tax=Mya arenaria TaxID=6604 RepID=A0ABY7FW97_MYAAR|nr:hypothetical protein MAR_037125 [Mya arenaria]
MHGVGVMEVTYNGTERPGGSSACIDKYCDETRGHMWHLVEMGVPDEQFALNPHEQGGHTFDQVDDQQADDTDIVICQLYYKSLLHVDMKVQDAGITAVLRSNWPYLRVTKYWKCMKCGILIRYHRYDQNSKCGGIFTEYINTFLKVKQEASG